MRKELIKDYIRQLSKSFGSARTTVAPDQLIKLYERKDYAGMVGYIRDSLDLDIRLRVHFAKEDEHPKAAAWIDMPEVLYLIGTLPFIGNALLKHIRLTVHIHKSTLQELPFEAIVLVLSHELCHIILHSQDHALRHEEVATDLTAMFLGYRNFYRRGCLGSSSYMNYKLGYLTYEEVVFAADTTACLTPVYYNAEEP